MQLKYVFIHGTAKQASVSGKPVGCSFGNVFSSGDGKENRDEI